MKKAEDRYDGFSIQVKADVRWIVEDEEVDAYTMRVWKEDGILVKVPSVEYTLLHNKTELDAHANVTEDVINSMDNARHYYEQEKAVRRWQHYLIEMPPGVTLSAKEIYDDAGDDEELDYELVNVTVTDPKINFTIQEHWLHFSVARTDTRIAKRGKVAKTSKKSKGANKLASLGNLMSG